jgi:hypothetical protein
VNTEGAKLRASSLPQRQKEAAQNIYTVITSC